MQISGISWVPFPGSACVAVDAEKERIITLAHSCMQRELNQAEMDSLVLAAQEMTITVRDSQFQRAIPWHLMTPGQRAAELSTPMHEITKNIYLGTDEYVRNCLVSGDNLKVCCPGVIITLCKIEEINPRDYQIYMDKMRIDYLRLPIEDSPRGFDQVKKDLSKIMGLFCEALAKGKKILIHCQMGRSRSPSILAFCMSKLTGASFLEAHHAIYLRRRQIQLPIRVCGKEFEIYQGLPNFMWFIMRYCEQGELYKEYPFL